MGKEEKNAQVAVGHLQEAVKLISGTVSKDAFDGFQDWIESDELELAMDELIGVFEGVDCPDVDAWLEILAAAENLHLTESISYVREKIDSLQAANRDN